MSGKRRRPSRPYLAHSAPRITEERATLADPVDRRVPEVPITPLPPGVLAVLTQHNAIDPRLRLTDQLFERWVSTPTGEDLGVQGSTLIPLSPRSTYVALPDADCELIDRVVRSSPPWARNFVKLWYRSGATAEEIAQKLRVKHRQRVYEERRLVLAYFLGRFVELRIERPGWPRA